MAVQELAQTHIAGREDIFDAEKPFPFDIWREMAKAGLLSMGLPSPYGGGLGYGAVMDALAAFVQAGRNLGLASVWLSQTLFGRLILAQSGNAAQQQRYLPALAGGQMVAVSISEPNAGAHPKRLSATAEREGDHWVLNGEKAWITNGPIADLYIILAISARQGERKQFSAFLVQRETPGLIQTNAGSVDYLRPARHGGLSLQNCRIPLENLLGPEGQAFETISKPLREVEDVLGLAIGQGGRQAQLEGLAAALALSQTAVSDEQLGQLGALQSDQAALRILAASLAESLDTPADSDPAAALLAARRMARQFQEDFSCLLKSLQIPEKAEISRLSRDLTKFADLALNVDRAKEVKLGKSLIRF
ncbi:unnamed protein product [Phaeothamnion confervicola]